jgi:hypothetical protein
LVHNYIFSVYIVDERFPDIYNSTRQPLLELGAIATKTINGNPEIMELDFINLSLFLQALKNISNSR